MKEDLENLEYAIAQYADGTLSEFDRRVMDERLANDAEARLLLEEYRHLDQALRNAHEVPNVDFARLAVHLSEKIADEPSHAAQPIKIGVWVRRMAIAAGVALVAGVGFQMIPSSKPVSPAAGGLVVSGPVIERPTVAPSVTIAVGPSDALRDRGQTFGLVDDSIIIRSPRVVISAADPGASSGDERLY